MRSDCVGVIVFGLTFPSLGKLALFFGLSSGFNEEADAVAMDSPAISAGDNFGAGGSTSGAQHAV